MKKYMIICFLGATVAQASYLDNSGDNLEERLAKKPAMCDEQNMLFVFTPDIEESDQEKIQRDILEGKLKGSFGISPMFEDRTLAAKYNVGASQTKTKKNQGCCWKTPAADVEPKFTTTITITKKPK